MVKISPSKNVYLLQLVPMINPTEKNKKCDISRGLCAGSSGNRKKFMNFTKHFFLSIKILKCKKFLRLNYNEV